MKKLVAGALLLVAASAFASVKKTAWGNADGKAVELYTINDGKITVSLTTYGARVVSILAPDRNGKMGDVALGYSSIDGYLKDAAGGPKGTYVGSIVGRYGNRIGKGTFTIDGKQFHVPLNNNGNALHGGTTGFDKKVWTAREIPEGVEFTLVSPDGDMGFPGTLTAHVRYHVVGTSLEISYTATTDKPTMVALTNHTYFNLAGEASGTVLDQKMMINADNYTPVDKGLIPSGQIAPVAGTPFDFRQPTAIGARIHTNNEQLTNAGGYDHNFVLNRKGAGLELAAKVVDPKSGRTLTVTTTEPGVQFYSGNFLGGDFTGKGGAAYQKYAGFCLETQHFPDSPNKPNFPSTLLRPGKELHSETVYTFGVEK